MQNRFLLFSLFCLMSGIFYAQNIPEKTFHVIDSLPIENTFLFRYEALQAALKHVKDKAES